MLRYAKEPPQNGFQLTRSTLHVRNAAGPVVAKLVLAMPQGDYITREIISLVVLARMASPQLLEGYNLDEIYYTLGNAQEAEDGSYSVPVAIYVLPR